MRTRSNEIPIDSISTVVHPYEDVPQAARWMAPPTTTERIDTVIVAPQEAKEAHAKVLAFTAEGPSGIVAAQRASAMFYDGIRAAEDGCAAIRDAEADS